MSTLKSCPLALLPKPARIVNPYGRKFLRDLQQAGIEVIDLLPDFLSAKQEDPKYPEPPYQKHDTHWTSARPCTSQLQRIADRIRHTAWYGELAKNAGPFIALKDTTCSAAG